MKEQLLKHNFLCFETIKFHFPGRAMVMKWGKHHSRYVRFLFYADISDLFSQRECFCRSFHDEGIVVPSWLVAVGFTCDKAFQNSRFVVLRVMSFSCSFWEGYLCQRECQFVIVYQGKSCVESEGGSDAVCVLKKRTTNQDSWNYSSH